MLEIEVGHWLFDHFEVEYWQMKAGIHPTYYPNAQVSCACGNSFTVGSTKPSFRVELCYKCHPQYTGVDRFADTVGTIDKYLKRKDVAAKKQAVIAERKQVKEEKERQTPRTLRDLLSEYKSR